MRLPTFCSQHNINNTVTMNRSVIFFNSTKRHIHINVVKSKFFYIEISTISKTTEDMKNAFMLKDNLRKANKQY